MPDLKMLNPTKYLYKLTFIKRSYERQPAVICTKTHCAVDGVKKCRQPRLFIPRTILHIRKSEKYLIPRLRYVKCHIKGIAHSARSTTFANGTTLIKLY